MASTSSNNQHAPSTSAAEFPATQPTTSSNLDSNAHLANSGYAPNENQLAGLVEAATAAAGQDVSEWAAAAAVAAAAGATSHQNHLDGYGADIHIDDDGFGDTGFGVGMPGRPLRGSAHDQGQSSGLARTATKKRKRNEDPLDPALTASNSGVGLPQQQHEQHPHAHHFGGEGLNIRSSSDARSVGLHSAAALFRQPSSNKKYTRPPMSKLFTSLELSPENFLHLQAAAKGYMLDDKHPERRECVGQRGKGDGEMVKLRLWNCVRHFLEAEGHGERFFGENVVNEGMGPRTYVWPRDQQKIISLVIPLLRRMVTNERQRQYAVETRKGGPTTDERRRRRTEDSIGNFNTTPSKFPSEDHLQLHAPQGMHDDYAHAQPPMSATSQQPVELGLTDLLLDGYPTDWEAISRSYDTYNHNYELDNLMHLSGLQQPDWRGLVAAVDSHYQIYHHGDCDCPLPCEDQNVGRILDSDTTADLRWRIGGNREARDNNRPRNEFASSITRDVSRIIRDSIAGTKHGIPPSTTSDDNANALQLPPRQSLHLPSASSSTQTHNQQSSLVLRINIMQHGKRILPRLDIPADHCPDLDTIKQAISRRFAGQIPNLPPPEGGLDWSTPTGPSPATADHPDQNPHSNSNSNNTNSPAWKVKVWLPDGLTPVQSDGEWTIALLSAGSVDWMDGDLRVLVDVEG